LLRFLLCGLAVALAAAAPRRAQELPQSLADLLRASSPSERPVIENVAKRLYPQQRQAIDDLVDEIEDEEKARVAESSIVAGWTGEVQLGASISTGNSEEWSVSGSTELGRKGLKWEHRLDASVDFRDVQGERTDERVSAGYRASMDFADPDWFALAVVRYDRDRSTGIKRRFTEGLGIGHKLIDSDNLDWEVTAGPALRQTLYEGGETENQLAAFASTEIAWEISETLTLREDASIVLDTETDTYRSETSLTKDLYGQLSARFSFTVEGETNPPPGNEKLDTYSRATLVLDF